MAKLIAMVIKCPNQSKNISVEHLRPAVTSITGDARLVIEAFCGNGCHQWHTVDFDPDVQVSEAEGENDERSG